MAKGTVFMSDLHLGDALWKSERYDLLQDFFDRFLVNHAERIVIAGDLTEWVQYGITAATRSFKALEGFFELAASGVPIHYVVGNHDLDFSVLPLHSPIKIEYPRLHLTIAEHSFHVEHGHFYDPTISALPAVSQFLTAWGGRTLDNMPPGIEDKLGQCKEALLRIAGRALSKRDPTKEELDGYAEAARTLAMNGGHDYVIMGHTHKKCMIELDVPGVVKPNAIYVNTGDWQVNSDFAFFVKEEMHLFSWKEQRNQAMAAARG